VVGGWGMLRIREHVDEPMSPQVPGIFVCTTRIRALIVVAEPRSISRVIKFRFHL